MEGKVVVLISVKCLRGSSEGTSGAFSFFGCLGSDSTGVSRGVGRRDLYETLNSAATATTKRGVHVFDHLVIAQSGWLYDWKAIVLC